MTSQSPSSRPSDTRPSGSRQSSAGASASGPSSSVPSGPGPAAMPIDVQVREILRGVSECLPSVEQLKARLAKGRPMKIKLGVDPTNFDLHLGHTVPLRKLRQLQNLGHHIQFLIGGFTARIGDPTGRSEARPTLTREQVQQYAQKFLDQVFTILDREKTEVMNNGDWFDRMTFVDAISLASQATVARMLERDYFQKRWKDNQPIHLHEFLYPLMQGWDSVEMKSDMEIGGNDQKFNILMGRQLQEANGQEPQVVLLLPLLPGTDGSQKMSKTAGNHIPVDDSPIDMYSKVLSVPDTVIALYFELLTDVPLQELDAIKRVLAWWQAPPDLGAIPLDVLPESDARLFESQPEEFQSIRNRWHPKNLKKRLGREIVATRHGREAGEEAEREWVRIHEPAGEGIPTDMPEIDLTGKHKAGEEVKLIDLAEALALVPSRGEIKRLAKQGGIKVNGEPVLDANASIALADGLILSAGKRKFVKVRIF